MPTTNDASIPQHSISNDVASFTMNKEKQLKKLCTDTDISDVAIEVSPSLQNVNIKCSTGYYFQVVAPAVWDLDIGCEINVSNMKVKCVDKVGKVDADGAGLNTRFKFLLLDNQQFSGSVTMHLHHTTRLVQVQGSSILPDKSRAPIWFVQNIMKHILSPLAATKSDEVTLFNNLVKTMLNNPAGQNFPSNTCGSCNLNFNDESALEYCQLCMKYYHKLLNTKN